MSNSCRCSTIGRGSRIACQLAATWLAFSTLLSNALIGDEATEVSFRSDIAPILRDSCLACHGPKKAEGGYRVDTYEELLKAGDSGEAPIAPSPQEVGELLRRIDCEDESERMPAESEALQPAQIELFRKWIAAGGKFDGERPSETIELLIPAAQYAAPPETYATTLPITAVTFVPDGKHIVTGGYHELLVWNIEDAKLVRRINNLGQRIFALAFSPDGRNLAVACGEPGRSGEVRLVEFNSGRIKGVVARTNDVVLDVALRPGTNQLAIASADSSIRIVDIETLQEIRTIASHADWVTALSWSDDGSRLASASRDKSAKVYDGESGELLASYLGHGAAVRGISILADNQQVVSLGDDQKMHRWNIEGAKKAAEISIGAAGYKLVRQGNHVLVPCSNQRLLHIDLGNNKISQVYEGHNDWVISVGYQSHESSEFNQGQLASGAFNGELYIWNVSDASLASKWVAKP